MLKMEIFRLGTTNGDKRLGTIIIFQKKYDSEFGFPPHGT
jgi:hypothetical protein